MKVQQANKRGKLALLILVPVLAAALWLLSGRFVAFADEGSTVHVPDATLRAAIIDTLELPGSTITPNDMKRLRTLETPENDPARQITDLTGLEYAENLIELNLDYNKITDLTPLAGLSKLEVLNLSYNNGAATGTDGMTDLSCLSGLTNLKSFSAIGNSGITDWSVLANFTQLKTLNLAICKVRDISFVKGMTQLEKLYLSFNEVSDLYPLQGLKALQTLALGSNRVADIAPLAELTALSRLTLENNVIEDFSAVLGLRSLTVLDVSRNFIDGEQIAQIMEQLTAEQITVAPSADESKKQGLFTLPQTSLTVGVGGTATVTTSGLAGGTVWYSTDPSVATVDGSGKVTGVAEGTCHVVVTHNGLTRGVAVTVSSHAGGSQQKPGGCGCGGSVSVFPSVGAAAGLLLLALAAVLLCKSRKEKSDGKKR